MLGASLIWREFRSWSARPWLLSALLQEALDEEANERGKLNICSYCHQMLSCLFVFLSIMHTHTHTY